MKERRERAITDQDIEAIKEALQRDHVCIFDPETRQILKTITTMYRDGQNVIIKAIVGALFVGFLYIAALGAGFVGHGK
jgi:hypothetical protein